MNNISNNELPPIVSCVNESSLSKGNFMLSCPPRLLLSSYILSTNNTFTLTLSISTYWRVLRHFTIQDIKEAIQKYVIIADPDNFEDIENGNIIKFDHCEYCNTYGLVDIIDSSIIYTTDNIYESYTWSDCKIKCTSPQLHFGYVEDMALIIQLGKINILSTPFIIESQIRDDNKGLNLISSKTNQLVKCQNFLQKEMISISKQFSIITIIINSIDNPKDFILRIHHTYSSLNKLFPLIGELRKGNKYTFFIIKCYTNQLQNILIHLSQSLLSQITNLF
ncbi:hypothetical protein QTN25_007354 [Entamoeba marina]